MKKYLLTVMAVAGLVSCSNETDSFNTADPNEIRVAAQTIDASTKAPLDSKTSSFRAMVLTTQDAGKYASLYQSDGGMYMDFTDQSGTEVGFVDADGAPDKKYYPSSTANNKKVIVSGLMPAAASSTEESSKSDIWKYDEGKFSITFDGNDDVMIAKEVEAEKGHNAGLTFEHLLTQLVVKVKVTGSTEPWGDVQRIVLKNVEGESGPIYNKFSLSGDELTSGTAKPEQTAATAGDVKFYKATDASFEDDEYTNAGTKLSSTATTVAYTLCQPFAVKQTVGDTDLVLDVYTTTNSVTPKTVKIDLTSASDLKSSAGYAFEITLDFQTNEIMASATIADWKEGGNGTGIID